MERKINIIKDFGDNKQASFVASGFHILNDTWITEQVKQVYCTETNKTYDIIDYKKIGLFLLKPENERLPAKVLAMLTNLSNWETRYFSAIKVKDDDLKAGHHITEVL